MDSPVMMKFNVSGLGAKEHIVGIHARHPEPLNNHIRMSSPRGMTMASSTSTKGMGSATFWPRRLVPGMYTLEITNVPLYKKKGA